MESEEAKRGLLARIAAAMDRAGMNDAKLAKALTTSSGTVAGWLKEGKMPGGTHLQKLPEALGVDGHWLLTGKGPMERVPPTAAQDALWEIEKIVAGVRAGAKDPHPPSRAD